MGMKRFIRCKPILAKLKCGMSSLIKASSYLWNIDFVCLKYIIVDFVWSGTNGSDCQMKFFVVSSN